jgi:hypothetical protein
MRTSYACRARVGAAARRVAAALEPPPPTCSRSPDGLLALMDPRTAQAFWVERHPTSANLLRSKATKADLSGPRSSYLPFAMDPGRGSPWRFEEPVTRSYVGWAGPVDLTRFSMGSQDPARVTSLSQWTSGGVRLGTPGAAETPRYFVTQTLSLEHSPLRGRYGLKGDTHYKSKGR